MVLVMVLTVLPSSTIALASNTATVSVESANAVPGTTIDVNINISNNPGIMAAAFTINYDAGLTLIDAKSGDAFSALSITKPENYSSPCKFAWDALDLAEEDIKDGTILTLTFEVAEDIEANSDLNIKITYSSKDIIDSNIQSVPLNVNNGKVTIIDYIPGDLNSDGVVDLKDVTMIRRFITGYSVSVNELAADVNGDGDVTMMDVVLIRRYVVDAEGYGVVLVPGNSKIHTHTMTATPAKTATCTEDGNIAYWCCSSCEKYFTDEKGNTEVSKNNTIIKSQGHTVVVDPAIEATYESTGLTEGSHCSVCNTVLKAQEVIPKLQRTEYSITYHISNGDEYLAQQTIANDNPSTYTSEEGILKFANPSVPGYQFLGWYDLPSGDAAENVKSIAVGTTGNIDLYARWEKISYKVNFSSDLIPIASETYTVDEEHVLPSPKLDGYIFVGWSDSEGTVIKNIPVGTVGAKTYTANWLSERNQAWKNNKLDAPIIYENEETNTILFAYNIGEIRNVPVSVIHDFGKINSNGVTKTVTTEVSKTVNTTCMENYTSTVQKATTDSFAWTLSSEWSDSVSIDESWLKEQGISTSEANTKYRDENNNWYISNGGSGSSTTSKVTGSDTTKLESTTKNKSTTNSDTSTEKTDVSAELNVSMGSDVTGKIEAGMSASVGTEDTHLDSTIKGKSSSQGTDVTEYGKVTTDTSSSWNSEKGYGSSTTVGESSTVSKELSEKISEQYSIGKSYINTDSESSTQGKSTSASSGEEYSSTVTYSTINGETRTETYTTENTISGYHRWVLAGTAHVFAVVGYDIETASYFVSTYSIMDDELYEYEDYSYLTSDYNDNQNSVIKFEVPYTDIVDYVANRIGKSEGLVISKTGVVTDYTGTDSCVLIPEYTVVDNNDGTKSVVKVSEISSTAFSNKDIETVIFSDFITKIPECAFENCKKLKNISAVGITQINDKAFNGCSSLGEVIVGEDVTKLGENVVDSTTKLGVVASNRDVVTAATKSGAKEITIAISDNCVDLNDVVISVPNTCEYFAFYGYDKTFENLRIVSDSETTIINRANLVCNGQTPLVFSSPNVELHEVSVTAPGICLALKADRTALALRGESTLKASSGNSMLCKEISLSQIDASLTTSLTVDGNLLIYTSKDSIVSGEKLLNVTGNIIGVTAEDYENHLKGVFTVNFNASGGTVSETSRVVVYGSKLGTLPIPTRDYYTFDGWYTAESGGEKVTADTVFTSTADVTYYAHWVENPTSAWVLEADLPENAKVVNEKWTYDLTSKTTSSSSSLSGWTLYDTKRTSWGATQGPVYSDPNNGSRNVWNEQYVASTTTHYVYYHRYNSGKWSDDAHASSWARHPGPDVTSKLPNGYYSSTTGQRYSGAACSQCGATNHWHLDYEYTTNNYATRWYYQDPVYTYYFKKTEAKESTTEVTASDSISNVKKYVQYVAK